VGSSSFAILGSRGYGVVAVRWLTDSRAKPKSSLAERLGHSSRVSLRRRAGTTLVRDRPPFGDFFDLLERARDDAVPDGHDAPSPEPAEETQIEADLSLVHELGPAVDRGEQEAFHSVGRRTSDVAEGHLVGG